MSAVRTRTCARHGITSRSRGIAPVLTQIKPNDGSPAGQFPSSHSSPSTSQLRSALPAKRVQVRMDMTVPFPMKRFFHSDCLTGRGLSNTPSRARVLVPKFSGKHAAAEPIGDDQCIRIPPRKVALVAQGIDRSSWAGRAGFGQFLTVCYWCFRSTALKTRRGSGPAHANAAVAAGAGFVVLQKPTAALPP